MDTSVFLIYKKYFDKVRDQDKLWRLEQARLPIEEKIKIVMEIQQLGYSILKAKGKKCHLPWGFDENKID